jgi:hypothetical protein
MFAVGCTVVLGLKLVSPALAGTGWRLHKEAKKRSAFQDYHVLQVQNTRNPTIKETTTCNKNVAYGNRYR